MNDLPMRLNPPSLPPSIGASQIAEARGRLAFISGQVSVSADDALVGAEDFAAQVEQVFRNLDIAAREAGASFRDVIKLNYFCLDRVDRALLSHISRVRDAYVDTARPPASTFVFVAGLARRAWLIEVEAVVALPEARPR
jgi:enamine deaminase RidA (YjgF/YER057c/UK114 family)